MSAPAATRTQIVQHRFTHRIPARLEAMLAAMLAPAAIWLATSAAGFPLVQPGFGTTPSEPLGLGWILVVAGLASVLAWAASAALRRLARRPARVWPVVSVACLILSLGGPFSGTGIDLAHRLALASMHLATGSILIAGLAPRASTSATEAK